MPHGRPADWPTISPLIFYEDADAAIDWLARAFGFEVRVKVDQPGGGILHSELVLGDGLVMVVSAQQGGRSPRGVGGANTQCLYAFVPDVDAHHARARDAGATITAPPEDQHYGDRIYAAEDPEGHRWWFAERVSDAARAAATAGHGA